MSIQLGDDGTLGTVVFCDVCGQEFRGNFEPDSIEASDDEAAADYQAYVDDFVEEVSGEHVCDEQARAFQTAIQRRNRAEDEWMRCECFGDCSHRRAYTESVAVIVALGTQEHRA